MYNVHIDLDSYSDSAFDVSDTFQSKTDIFSTRGLSGFEVYDEPFAEERMFNFFTDEAAAWARKRGK